MNLKLVFMILINFKPNINSISDFKIKVFTPVKFKNNRFLKSKFLIIHIQLEIFQKSIFKDKKMDKIFIFY